MSLAAFYILYVNFHNKLNQFLQNCIFFNNRLAPQIPSVAQSAQLVKRVCLGNTSIYRSQQGIISDSPKTHFERVGEVSRFSFSNSKNLLRTLEWTPDTDTKAKYGGCVLHTAPKKPTDFAAPHRLDLFALLTAPRNPNLTFHIVNTISN